LQLPFLLLSIYLHVLSDSVTYYRQSIFGLTIMTGTVTQQKSLGVRQWIIFALREVFYIAYFAFVCGNLLEFAKANIPANKRK
jgi:uncharacterized membrane protein YoaK (UPF0700 family)